MKKAVKKKKVAAGRGSAKKSQTKRSAAKQATARLSRPSQQAPTVVGSRKTKKAPRKKAALKTARRTTAGGKPSSANIPGTRNATSPIRFISRDGRETSKRGKPAAELSPLELTQSALEAFDAGRLNVVRRELMKLEQALSRS